MTSAISASSSMTRMRAGSSKPCIDASSSCDGNLDTRPRTVRWVLGNRQLAAMALDDLGGDGEAQARPLPGRLGREERLGGARRVLRADADPIVVDDEGHALGVLARGDVDVAAGRARLARVEQEVDDRVLEQRAVAPDVGHPVWEIHFE